MAFKRFVLDDATPITVYKRKSSRNLRLTVSADGLVKVSIPRWIAYAIGLKFAQSRSDWIRSQRRPAVLLSAGQPVGKSHRLRFAATAGADKVTSRVQGTEVVVYHPPGLAETNPEIQQSARLAGTRALRKQAENLLPRRLDSLAAKHGFTYASVKVKQMKSRWGSCDSQSNIVLNLYLMQLPWEHIDYVILHELTHTRILRHGPDFWLAMESVLPGAKAYRKVMRQHQPMLHSSQQVVA